MSDLLDFKNIGVSRDADSYRREALKASEVAEIKSVENWNPLKKRNFYKEHTYSVIPEVSHSYSDNFFNNLKFNESVSDEIKIKESNEKVFLRRNDTGEYLTNWALSTSKDASDMEVCWSKSPAAALIIRADRLPKDKGLSWFASYYNAPVDQLEFVDAKETLSKIHESYGPEPVIWDKELYEYVKDCALDAVEDYISNNDIKLYDSELDSVSEYVANLFWENEDREEGKKAVMDALDNPYVFDANIPYAIKEVVGDYILEDPIGTRDYLLRKEECCPLDKEEMFILQDLIQRYGKPDVFEESKLKEEIDLSEEEQDLLWDIANRYNTSVPVSGSWKTETEHEINTIMNTFGISKKQAIQCMKKYLGWTDEEFEHDHIKLGESEKVFNESEEDDLQQINFDLENNHLDPEDAEALKDIDLEINSEDYQVFIEEIKDLLNVKDIKSVEYADPSDGYDGAYKVTLKDESVKYFDWKDFIDGLVLRESIRDYKERWEESCDNPKLKESYSSFANKLYKAFESFMKSKGIKRYSYTDYVVEPSWARDGIRIEFEWDEEGKLTEDDVRNFFTEKFPYGVHVDRGWGHNWDHYLTVFADDKVCYMGESKMKINESAKYYNIEVDGNFLEDEFGNTLRFDTMVDALEYIDEHEIEDAEIVSQHYDFFESKMRESQDLSSPDQVKEILEKLFNRRNEIFKDEIESVDLSVDSDEDTGDVSLYEVTKFKDSDWPIITEVNYNVITEEYEWKSEAEYPEDYDGLNGIPYQADGDGEGFGRLLEDLADNLGIRGVEEYIGLDPNYYGKYKRNHIGESKIKEASDFEFDYSGWDEEDIKLHKEIDWEARDYKEFIVPGTEYEGSTHFYSDHGLEIVKEKYAKILRPNPNFPPYYGPVDNTSTKEWTSAMYDGRKKDGYDLHDRRESWDIYRALSEKEEDGIAVIIHDITPDTSELDSFFDVLPDILQMDGLEDDCATYGYAGPASIKVHFTNKDAAEAFAKNINTEFFDVEIKDSDLLEESAMDDMYKYSVVLSGCNRDLNDYERVLDSGLALINASYYDYFFTFDDSTHLRIAFKNEDDAKDYFEEIKNSEWPFTYETKGFQVEEDDEDDWLDDEDEDLYEESKMSEGLTANHVRYVLENVLNWDRGWDFDKRSIKQIAQACHDYDDDYSTSEYARAIKLNKDVFLTKNTKNSIYRTKESWDQINGVLTESRMGDLWIICEEFLEKNPDASITDVANEIQLYFNVSPESALELAQDYFDSLE